MFRSVVDTALADSIIVCDELDRLGSAAVDLGTVNEGKERDQLAW